MRFMMLMFPGDDAAATEEPKLDPKAMESMSRYNESLRRAGILLAVDGLLPSTKATRISFETGKPHVIDGPFPEVKEMLGGYWMLQVKSREEAIEWAKRCPAGPNDKLELRRVAELSDLPPEVQKVVASHSEMQPKSR